MYKKGIIFDNVGPLFSDPLMDLTWLAEKYGIDPDRLNEAKDELWVERFSVDPGMSSYDFWQGTFNGAGYVAGREEIDAANAELLERHEPHQRMLDYARQLKGNPGVMTALWTNNSREWFIYLNDRFGLVKHFDYIAVSGMQGKRKGEPEIISNLVWVLAINGCHDIAGLDDQEGNLAVLRDAHVSPAILYGSDEQAIGELDRFLGELHE